jgi:membrane fusion protein, copper/silver efflux system
MKSISLILIISATLLLPSCDESPSPHAGHADSTGTRLSNDYYTCPMHPQVHKDKPGVCPICGMDLVKASNSAKAEGGVSVAGIALSERDQILADVSTLIVDYEDVEHTTRAFGSLQIAEPNKALISARFNGRVERLHVDAVGAHVRVGDPLFDIYSPDIVQAANEYVQALRSGSQSQTNASVIKAKLALMGLTEGQIRDLDSAGSAPLVLTYRSPVSGTVIEKRVVRGSYVSEGAPLFEIADLSTLWNVAEVFESDAGNISVGHRVSIRTAAYPNTEFRGTVALIYPVVNSETRAIGVRVIVANPSGNLKPNMYTETVFGRAKKRVLTVPAGAVLVTGKRNLVYVKVDNENHFQAREVLLGARLGSKYEIISGLSAGEEVVREGGYLIDSESQLKSGGGAEHQHGGSPAAGSTIPGTSQHDH